MPVELVFDHLASGEHGISDTEALARRRIHGRNAVSSQRPPSCFMLFLSIIPNPFNILLVFLAIINAAMPPPNWVSALSGQDDYLAVLTNTQK
jgi:Mg2+-importing ATPase